MKALKIIQTVLLSIIGAVSVFMTTATIFDLFGMQEKHGNYVLFIVYTNLTCGILYLIAAYTAWVKPMLSFRALCIALVLLIVAFIAFLLYINNGGIHEARTVRAMIFRIIFTAVMVGIGWWGIKKE